MKEETIIKKIEEKASIFKTRATRSPKDNKRHDLVKPDEQREIFNAHSKLGWSNTKIGGVFARDQRTVAQCIKKEKRDLTNLESNTTVKQTLKDGTFNRRLSKHLDELAQTAKILAHHSQRLLRYKGDNDVESKGNVFEHIFFWRVSNKTVVEESIDPTSESIYEGKHPIDPFMAKLLGVHYEERFGSLPCTEWRQLSNRTVTNEIIENLKFLAYGGLKKCPNCPICKEMTD